MFPGQHTHTKISASRASTRKRTHMLSEYPHLQKHTHTRTQLQTHWFMDVAVNICIYVCIYTIYPQTFRQEVVMTASAKLARIRWQKMWQHCMIHLRKIGVWLWKNKKKPQTTSNNQTTAIHETWRKQSLYLQKYKFEMRHWDVCSAIIGLRGLQFCWGPMTLVSLARLLVSFYRVEGCPVRCTAPWL